MQGSAGTLVLFGTVDVTNLFSGYPARNIAIQKGDRKLPENSK